MKDNFLYLKWLITLVVTYFVIKLIDNYQYFFDFFHTVISILKPFIFAIVIAYILDPIIKFMEKKLRFKRGWSILFSYSIIVGLTGLFIFFVIPAIGNSIAEIFDNIPQYTNMIEEFATNIVLNWEILLQLEFLKDPNTLKAIEQNFLDIIPNIGEFVQTSLNGILSTTLSITTLVVNLVFAFIISIYLLIDKEKILRFTKKSTFMIVRKQTADKLVEILGVFNANIGTYIIAKSIDSLFVGIVSFIGLQLIGSEYALLFGIICGLTNMIPYFGPFLGMVPVVIINLFYDPMIAVWSLVFLIIVQQIEGNIIEPRFVGGKLGLSPLLTLLAVAVGGGFFGIIGMILAVPVMGVIKIYVDEIMREKQKEEDQTEELITE